MDTKKFARGVNRAAMGALKGGAMGGIGKAIKSAQAPSKGAAAGGKLGAVGAALKSLKKPSLKVTPYKSDRKNYNPQ